MLLTLCMLVALAHTWLLSAPSPACCLLHTRPSHAHLSCTPRCSSLIQYMPSCLCSLACSMFLPALLCSRACAWLRMLWSPVYEHCTFSMFHAYTLYSQKRGGLHAKFHGACPRRHSGSKLHDFMFGRPHLSQSVRHPTQIKTEKIL